MHLPQWVQKIIMGTLVVALLMPGIYVALTPQAPVEAQIINLGTMLDLTAIANFVKNIADKIWEVTKIAIDVALYKTVKYAVRQLGDQSAQWVGRTVSGGKVGQEPLFWEQTPQQMLEQTGEAAGGFFIEGMAEGIATEQEMQKSGLPKDRAMKEKRGAILQQSQQIIQQMCNPDPRFRFDLLAGIVGNLSLSFGLPIPPFGLPFGALLPPGTKKTEKPACSFTQAYTSWKKVVVDTTTQISDQMKGVYDTIANFPKAIADAFEQDKRDVTDAFNRIGSANTALANDANYKAKTQALINTISGKLGIPTDFNNLDVNALQKSLGSFQTNLRNIPNDPEVKGNLDQVRAVVKEKAPDAPIQAKLALLSTYVTGDVYQSSTGTDKTALRNIYNTIEPGGGIDNPFIVDRLREMQGLASKDSNVIASAEFGKPLKELLEDQGLSSRALFNRAELVVKNLGNNPKVQSLIGGAQDAAGQQAASEQENANRRVTGNLTGWQVLQDLTDPNKANDATVQSKTQSTLNDFLAKMREGAVLQRTETGGPKPVVTLSGQVTSPPFSVAALVSGSIAGQVNQEGKFTGNAVVDAADLIGEFADSIFAKSGQMIMEGFTKTNPDQPVAQQNKIGELVAAIGSRPTGEPGGEPIASTGVACGPDRTCPAGLECDDNNKCQLVGVGDECSSTKPCPSPTVCDTTVTPNKCKQPDKVVQGLGCDSEHPCPDGLVCNASGQCETPFPTGDNGVDIAAQAYINQGVGEEPQPSSDLITNPAATIDVVRRASIEARISKLVALPQSKEEQMNVLGTLGSDCVPGTPDSCTIRPAFSQAIQNKLTIAESVARFKQTGGSSGLDENMIFGFKRGMAGSAIEPDLSQGIPYGSMVILRKYRILPVAWEIAALYIKDHPGACGQQDCTLKDLVNRYGNASNADGTPNPFHKLIDPNWVLKAPAAKCVLKGYGPPIEQIGAGEGSQNENAQWVCRGNDIDRTPATGAAAGTIPQCKVEYKIQPRSQICLDQQTCLDEDSKGNCKGYGYCLEEKKRWQFDGTECKKQYNSCLSFTNTTTGVTTGFLRDSLTGLGRGSTCNMNNAGCGWYSSGLVKKDSATDGSQRSQYDWSGADTSKVYFTSRAKDFSCAAESEGCRGLVRQSELVNFAPQSDTLGNSNGWCGDTEGSWSVCAYGSDGDHPNPRPTITWQQVVDTSPNGVQEPIGKITRVENGGGGGEYRIHLHKKSHGLDDVKGKTFTFSVWAKASANTTIQLRLGQDSDQGSNDSCSIGTSWTRCSFTNTTSTVAAKYNPADELRAYLYTSAGDVFVYGAQVEQNSFATEYQKNTPAGNDRATYLKVAPTYYGCADNPTGADTTQPIGYKKDICKGFALHCPAQYGGCSSYTPTNGDPAVSGITPIACDAACSGLTRFAQVKTQLETPAKAAYDFIPSTAQKCTADQVGCDEYTNLEGGAAGGGEQQDAYASITRCVKKLATAEDQRAAHQDVFYSWIGSETGGSQLEKLLLVSTEDTAKSPVCWKDPTGKKPGDTGFDCGCNSALNGPGRPLCRQFFRLKPGTTEADSTQSWWRIQDDLVYVTDSSDCTQYRRTLDGTDSTTKYYISKSMSRSCSLASAGCREYHATQAGNMTALPPDTFSDKLIGRWVPGPADGNLTLSATTEGETLGDSSLKIANADTTKSSITMQKPVALRSGSVMFGFAIKGPAGAKVSAQLYTSPNADATVLSGETPVAQTAGSSLQTDDINGAWQYFQYAASNIAVSPNDNPVLRITLTKNEATAFTQFYLDDITVRQSDGIIYVIKGSWHGKAPAQCYTNAASGKNWDVGVADQLSCQNYTDKAGNQMTFQRFTALCPKEMVGCTTFIGSTGPIALVDDPKKYCKQQDNKCTAYGQPQFDTKKAVTSYKNIYVKILPNDINTTNPDYSRGICKSTETDCQDYATKYGHDYFKNPGVDVARWRPAGSVCNGTSTRCTKSSDCSGGAACVQEDAPNGVWYYMTCGANAADATDTTKCLSDMQCSSGKQCIHEVKVDDTDMSHARLCPSNQSTCSKVVDPECRTPDAALSNYLTLRTNYGRTAVTADTGIACQRDYYYLDNVYGSTGQCTGKVDVEKGCLLFQADYPFSGQGKKVDSAYDTNTIYRAGGTDLNATGQTNKDANVLVKVRLDRACKTWLGCTDEQVDASGHRTCTERRPCIELDQNGECANFVDTETPAARDDMPELKAAFDTSTDVKFASLTGLSRPSVSLKSAPTDRSGVITHDGFFDWGGDKSKISAIPGRLSAEVPVICRSHPQKDTPSAKCEGTPDQILICKKDKLDHPLDYCSYDRDNNNYVGLKGFCLEKYQKKGYENYCLNWYPTDKPAGALPAFDASPSGKGAKAFAPNTSPINYCIKSEVNTIKARSDWANGNVVAVVGNKSDTVTPTALALTFKPVEVRTDGDNTCTAYGIAPGKVCNPPVGTTADSGGCSHFSDTTCAVTKTGSCSFANVARTCVKGPYGNGTPIGSCSPGTSTTPNSCIVQESGTCDISSYRCDYDTTKQCSKVGVDALCNHQEDDLGHCVTRNCLGTGYIDNHMCQYDSAKVNSDKCGSLSGYSVNNISCANNNANGKDPSKCAAQPQKYWTTGTCSVFARSCSISGGTACPVSGGSCTATKNTGTCSHPGTQTCDITGGTGCPTSSTLGLCTLKLATGGTCAPSANTQKMSCSTAGTDQSTSTQENDDKGYMALESGTLTAPTIPILKADGTTPIPGVSPYAVPLTKENIQSITYSASGSIRSARGDEIATDVTTNNSLFAGYFGGVKNWTTVPCPGGVVQYNGSGDATCSVMTPFLNDRINQKCHPDWPFLAVYPYFNGTGGTLSGFKYVLCADARTASKSLTVSATINFKPWKYWSRRETRQLELTDTYCKEFAQVAQGANTDSPSSQNVIPANRVDGTFATDNIINVNPSNKPYSFGTTELLDTREYYVITRGALPTTTALMTTTGTLSGQSYTPNADSYPSTLPAARVHDDADATTVPTHIAFNIAEKALADIRGFFVKIYNFFTLNNAKTSYTSSNTASTASNKTTSQYWADRINENNTFPLVSSRRCATNNPNAPANTEILCSATKVCPKGETDCSVVKDDTFILTFPRESANQQIATMQFFASTQEDKTPLRRLLIQWGEGDIKEVYNSVGSTDPGIIDDNRNGFPGKVYPPAVGASDEDKKEFTFVHTYATTFWRKPEHYNGTDVCIFVQDNWYYWKKVCGRFYKGPSGFIELKKDYGGALNGKNYSNGWWMNTGKGNFAAPQPAPGKCATATAVVTPEKTCGLNTECASLQVCKWSW